MNNQPITCIGEILWDALPRGLFLGGAPLNVCLHLHQLGEPTAIVSRVGQDRLGREALARIESKGLRTDYIQRDDDYETGFVRVNTEAEEAPDYDIIQPAAWDFIDITISKIRRLLSNSWAVVFGSLAQRTNTALRKLTDLECLKVLDINLRYPHYRTENVKYLINHSDVIKLNEDELELLKKWYSLPDDAERAARKLASTCSRQTICITRGAMGASLLHNGRWFEHSGYTVEVADTVGAGDAFLAALLHGLKTGKPDDELLPFANAAGAYVAGQSGANPDYSINRIKSIQIQ